MADDDYRGEQSIWHAWREAAIKFDYFVTGGTAALCAFIGQTAEFGRLGVNPQTLELVALLVLVFSVAVGFARIEKLTHAFGMNYNVMTNARIRRQIEDGLANFKGPGKMKVFGELKSPAEVEEIVKERRAQGDRIRASFDRVVQRSEAWYLVRNITLAVGFLMLVAARVWAPYFSP
jgi:hypothetical protein